MASVTSKNSWLPVLTGRLVICFTAACVVALLLPFGVLWSLLLVNGVLLVLWIVDCVLSVRPSTVGVERSLPQIVPLRRVDEITWTVSNPTRGRLRVVFADALQPSLGAERRGAAVRIPKSGRASVRSRICPQRRGRFVISRIAVRTFGPLYLGGRQGWRDSTDVLRVYPSFQSRREAELRIEKARISEVGLRSVRGHGGGTEFEQLREYTIDDDFRRIDWAATARTLKTIVRTYRAERNQNVVCLLDCGRVMAGRVDDVPRLDHAMDAVMAVSTVATRLGDRVGLIAFQREVVAEVAAQSGNSQVARMTEAMYQLEPKLEESDYRSAFLHLLSRFRRRSLVIIFTELSEFAVSEALAPALNLLAKRHMLVVASVQDPQVALWARSVPTEGNKAFLKAAAVSSLEKRKRTAALLRSRGVTVVDDIPGKVAAALADAYLAAKATGSL